MSEAVSINILRVGCEHPDQFLFTDGAEGEKVFAGLRAAWLAGERFFTWSQPAQETTVKLTDVNMIYKNTMGETFAQNQVNLRVINDQMKKRVDRGAAERDEGGVGFRG